MNHIKVNDEGFPVRQWWYITYYCMNHTSSHGVTAEYCISPAHWSIEASAEYEDGPYIVVYAEPITPEQAEYINGYMV